MSARPAAVGPLDVATLLRLSRPDSVRHFTEGGCWEFYALIRRLWPEAKPLWSWKDGHVAVRIGELLFDIRGRIRPPHDYREKPVSFWRADPPHRWVNRPRGRA